MTTSGDSTAHTLVAEGAVLLDVRTENEYAGGHLEGARNIPVHVLESRLDEFSPEVPVVVYCRSGMRSSKAAMLLRESGVQTVHDLGGMHNWEGGPNMRALLFLGFLCATLGLAPFAPEPHLIEKLRWLFTGAAFRPIDLFDLVLHGSPWVLLVAYSARTLITRSRT